VRCQPGERSRRRVTVTTRGKISRRYKKSRQAPNRIARDKGARLSVLSAPTATAPPGVVTSMRKSVRESVRAALRREIPTRRVLFAGAIALAGATATLVLVGWRRSSVMVHTPLQIGLVAVAGASIAIADTLIKRAAAVSTSFSDALTHPMMVLAVALYVLQIVLVAYIFVTHWELSTLGFSQMIVYAATVLFAGMIIFQERITLAQGVGLALALAGALLMSV
jgi:drug/metabolite transporter (DMT)-like permease